MPHLPKNLPQRCVVKARDKDRHCGGQRRLGDWGGGGAEKSARSVRQRTKACSMKMLLWVLSETAKLTETHREMLNLGGIEEATAVRPYKSQDSASAFLRYHLVVDCGARATTSMAECQACKVPKARYYPSRSKYRTGTYAGLSPCSVQELRSPVTCIPYKVCSGAEMAL